METYASPDRAATSRKANLAAMKSLASKKPSHHSPAPTTALAQMKDVTGRSQEQDLTSF